MSKYEVVYEGGVSFEGDEEVVPVGSIVEKDPDSKQIKRLLKAGVIQEVVEFQVGAACVTEDGKPGTLQPAGEGNPMVCVADDAENSDKPTTNPEQPAVEPVAEAPGEVEGEPRKRYRGQILIVDGKRTVGEQTFHHIKLADGSELDLTDAEYRTEVHVSYPPAA